MSSVNKTGAAFLFAAVLLWSFLPIPFRYSGGDAIWMSGARAAFGALALALVCRPSGIRLNMLRLQLPVGIGYVLTNAFWMLSAADTSVANSLSLVYTGPLICLLLNWFIRAKRPSLKSALFVPFGFVGVLVVVSQDLTYAGKIGIGFGLLGGCSLGAHLLFVSALRDATPNASLVSGQVRAGLFWGQLFGMLLFLLIGLLLKRPLEIAPGHGSWFWCLVFGAGWSVSLLCYAHGASAFEGHVTGTVTMLEVLFGSILAAIILKEIPAWNSIIGGAMIMFAAAVVVADSNGKRKEH